MRKRAHHAVWIAAVAAVAPACASSRPATPLRERSTPPDCVAAFERAYPGLREEVGAALLQRIDTPPARSRRPSLRYPEDLRRNRIQGHARVAFLIRRNGRPTNLVTLSATHPQFAEAARAAIRSSRYEPATTSGEPVPVLICQRVDFTIAAGRDGADATTGSYRAP